jgi:cytochrome c553
MSSLTKRILGFALLISTPVCFAAPVGDLVAGKKQAEQKCASCHGKDGNSTSAANPKLAGQHASYIIKQLKDFKSGKRVGQGAGVVMKGIALGLKEQEMINIAAYYQSQKVTLKDPNQKMITLGRKVYEGGNPKTGVPACIGCHSPTGSGNGPAMFPSLSGQHPQYAAAQLKAFRDAARAEATAKSLDKSVQKLPGRSNDLNRMMRTVVLNMSDDEINAVAEYLVGLHAPAPKKAAAK